MLIQPHMQTLLSALLLIEETLVNVGHMAPRFWEPPICSLGRWKAATCQYNSTRKVLGYFLSLPEMINEFSFIISASERYLLHTIVLNALP